MRKLIRGESVLHVVRGRSENNFAMKAIEEVLLSLDLNGTLYFGYPVLATPDEKIVVDALVVCEEYGVVLFKFVSSIDVSDESILAEHDDLKVALESKLRTHKELRQRTKLVVPVEVVVFFPHELSSQEKPDISVATPSTLPEVLSKLASFDRVDVFPHLTAVVDRVAKIKPLKKRENVRQAESRGAKIREIEKQIANLDRWQRDAVIAYPEGIQRIGGLAGSGKTVVLALKAAYLHSTHPDWKIAITFYTQSLYQQFQDLIRRFTYEHTQEEPDWERVRLLHCWGGMGRAGLCFEVAQAHGLPILDFGTAKSQYGISSAFEGTCAELLSSMVNRDDLELFDAVLIDEAQDLPKPFFEIVYQVTKEPKRIVYAYDELQNLTDQDMGPPEELFGKLPDGRDRVSSSQMKDILLPVCYRNTPWALVVAHGIGLGVYRNGGLVQMFDSSELWKRIGYKLEGDYEPGQEIVLSRRTEATPGFFAELLNSQDAVVCKAFDSAKEQAQWIAKSISDDIRQQELQPSDVLIVFPDPKTAQRNAAPIVTELTALNIPSHMVGVTSQRHEFFRPNSVALAHIFRAKGNEAPMVYVVDAQYGYNDPFGLARRRNTLFTGITRSRGWVRITGWGPQMKELAKEISDIEAEDFTLRFLVPTKEELDKKRRIYRDMSRETVEKIEQTKKSLEDHLKLLESGEVSIEDLPEDLRARLQAVLKTGT